MNRKFCFLFLFAIFTSSSLASWNEETVRSNIFFHLNSNASVSVDGVPHVFYRGKKLYHSYLNNGTWIREILDERLTSSINAASSGVAVTHDTKGDIHLIYDDQVGQLNYAVGREGDWKFISTPLIVAESSGANVGDIVVDVNGYVHVFYVAGNTGQVSFSNDLEHAVFDGMTWSRTVLEHNYVGSCGGVCRKVTAEMDASGDIHVVYNHDVPNSEEGVYHQVYTGNVWTKTTVYSGDSFSVISSEKFDLVINNDNKPMVCYWGLGNTEYCAVNTGGIWNATEWLVSGSPFTKCTYFPIVLTKDSTGIVHGVRVCDEMGEKYVERIEYSSGVWSAFENSIYEYDNAVFLLEHAGGVPYIFTTKNWGLDPSLYVLYPDTGVLVKEDISAIDNYSELGVYPNVIFDNNDTLHVTYNSSNYSTHNNTEWINSILPSGNPVHSKLPVAVSSDGVKHFFYGNNSGYTNKYIQHDGSVETVFEDYLPSSGNSDAPPISIIDSSDRRHIMYLDIDNWSIVYANDVNGSWVSSNAYSIAYSDLEKSVFSQNKYYTSLDFKIDINNNITAAFVEWHNDTFSKLIKLSRTENVWSSEVIAESSDIDLWVETSVIVDFDHKVHMAFKTLKRDGLFNYPNGISYGTNKSGLWQESKISTESYYFDDLTSDYLPGWVTGLAIDISVNKNNDIFLSYIQGSLDNSAINQISLVSEIRAVKLDDCLPVSERIFEELIIDHNIHIVPVAAYIDGAINSAGLGAIAFYDKGNEEPHILRQGAGIVVSSCATSENRIKIKITNTSSTDTQLGNVELFSLISGAYNNVTNYCVNTLLIAGLSCDIDVDINLKDSLEIDYLNNVDSSLFLDVYIIDGKDSKKSGFMVETSSLRPANLVDDTDTLNNSASSGGGSFSLVWLVISLLLLSSLRYSNILNRDKGVRPLE